MRTLNRLLPRPLFGNVWARLVFCGCHLVTDIRIGIPYSAYSRQMNLAPALVRNVVFLTAPCGVMLTLAAGSRRSILVPPLPLQCSVRMRPLFQMNRHHVYAVTMSVRRIRERYPLNRYFTVPKCRIRDWSQLVMQIQACSGLLRKNLLRRTTDL